MKKFSYIAIGLVAGLIIGMTSNAYAQEVSAAFSKFVFKVNGKEKQLESDPLVYQGSTYLPVRVVANMLGYDVTYKSDLRTIEMSEAMVEEPYVPKADPKEAAAGSNPVAMELEKVRAEILKIDGKFREIMVSREKLMEEFDAATPERKEQITAEIKALEESSAPLLEERKPLVLRRDELETQLQQQ